MVEVKEDLTGRVFTRLTVIKQVEDYVTPGGQHHAKWLCECSCKEHTLIEVLGANLKKGNTQSCGCIHREITSVKHKTHGDSYHRHRLYTIWANMKARCYNTNSQDYLNYGGRGITVCDEWKEDYITFKTWALDNGYEDKLTIDRIDVNGNYEPSNCRWSDMFEQENNRTNNHLLEYNNEIHTVQEWARITGICANTIYTRLNRGWTIERALTTYVGDKNGKI